MCLYYTYICIIYSLFLENLFLGYSKYYSIINFLNSEANVLVLLVMYVILYQQTNISRNGIEQIVLVVVTVLGILSLLETYSSKLVSFIWMYNNTPLSINTNLLNGIMLIHPLILYVAYATILTIVTQLYYHIFFLKNVQHKLKKKNILQRWVYYYDNWLIKTNYRLYLMCVIATVLGCWWAEQELSWGGWWSWDFVEILAISIIILLKLFLHSNFLENFNFKTNNTVKGIHFKLKMIKSLVVFTTLLLSFLINTLCVRFNLVNSVHNFVELELSSQHKIYLYLIITLVIVVAMLPLTTYIHYLLKGFFSARWGFVYQYNSYNYVGCMMWLCTAYFNTFILILLFKPLYYTQKITLNNFLVSCTPQISFLVLYYAVILYIIILWVIKNLSNYFFYTLEPKHSTNILKIVNLFLIVGLFSTILFRPFLWKPTLIYLLIAVVLIFLIKCRVDTIKINKVLHTLTIIYIYLCLNQLYLFSEFFSDSSEYFIKLIAATVISEESQLITLYKISEVVGGFTFLEFYNKYTYAFITPWDWNSNYQTWFNEVFTDVFIQISTIPNRLAYNESIIIAVYTKYIHCIHLNLIEFFNFSDQLVLQPNNLNLFSILLLTLTAAIKIILFKKESGFFKIFF